MKNFQRSGEKDYEGYPHLNHSGLPVRALVVLRCTRSGRTRRGRRLPLRLCSSPMRPKRQEDWRVSMARFPSEEGRFQSTYPSREWQETLDYRADIPFVTRRGPRPLVVGNGDDISAQAPAGSYPRESARSTAPLT